MHTTDPAEDPRPTCSSCGCAPRQEDLVATSVGYKCRDCAKPVAKVRRPFRHPVLTTLLADDDLTFLTRPLALALAAGMLAGFVGRSLATIAPWAGAATAAALGLLIGEVVLLSSGERPLRVHAAVAVVGVFAASAVAQLPFAPMAVGALIAAAWLLVPAASARH